MKKFISLFMSLGVVIAIALLISPSVVLAVPVVDAGPDQTFSLPRDFTVLAGSASDPGGIAFVSWTSIGPNAPNIINPGAPVTNVNGLVAGTYVFRLTVFNFSFQSSFDEVTVTVLPECTTCEFQWVSSSCSQGQGFGEWCSAKGYPGCTENYCNYDETDPTSPYYIECNSSNVGATAFNFQCSGNSNSHAWGECGFTCTQMSLPPAVPTVIDPTATNITSTSATLGANVTSLGIPASISARGTCWGTSPAPTTNCTAASGLTTGVFTHSRTGFSIGTTYYYRGYATNSTGTGYSPDDATFTTAGPDLVPASLGYISPVPSPTVGIPASFGMEIRNAGTVSTVTNFINRLRKANDVSGSGATNVATNSAGPLAASAQTSGFSIYYTPLATDVGTKWFSICADENLSGVGTVNETNENNNCGAWTEVTISNPITYSYSFNSNGGSPTYASVNQAAGSTVNSPGSPTRSGYNFTGWSPTLPTPMPVGGGSSVAQWSLSSPPSVSCTVNPQPSALIGETVTWSANPSGGTPPYSYQWMSVVPGHIPTPAPTTRSFSITYSTIGIKNAYVQVTDSTEPVRQITQCASPGPSIEIKFNPSFEEF